MERPQSKDDLRFLGNNDPGVSGRITNFFASARERLEYFKYRKNIENNPQAYMAFKDRKLGIDELRESGGLSPEDELFIRRTDRIIELGEANIHHASRKEWLFFGSGVGLGLAGIIGNWLPAEIVSENLQLLVRAGSVTATICGLAIVLSPHFRRQPVSFDYDPNPHNYPEGYDVSLRIRNSLKGISLDPDDTSNDINITKSLKNGNLGPDN